MSCPSNSHLHDLVTSELSEAEHAEVLAHVKSCPKCEDVVRQLLVMYRSVALGVAAEGCPSANTIEALVGGRLGDDVAKTVREHVEKCRTCEAKRRIAMEELLENSEALSKFQKVYDQAVAETLGRRAAEEAMQRLLPRQSGLIDMLWDKVLATVERLRGGAEEPAMGSGDVALEGALGFSSASDPEVRATWTIMLTTQRTAEEVVASQGRREKLDIEGVSRHIALECGAGMELANRLSSILPVLLTM